jgi:multidrug resistance efflux pump
MTQPDMKKEYRAELRTIMKHLRTINRQVDRVYRMHQRSSAALERAHISEKSWLEKTKRKEIDLLARDAKKLMRRKDILKGRLS